jgi:hypothetical protein
MRPGKHAYRRGERIGLIAAVVASLLVAIPAAPLYADTTPRVLDRADYAARLRALWMGECIANWTGLRTEGQVTTPPFLTDAAWDTNPFPDRPWVHLDLFLYANPWAADDDTDIEYVYLHAMHTKGVNRFTPALVAQEWTDHINSYIWVSNAAARALISTGVRPPMTALAQGLDPAAPADQSLMIDAQLTTEFFGVLSPGMPERALQMADLPIRTSARGYAAHAAQFYVVLYSLASQVDRTMSGREQAIWLVREARKYIPDSSKSADVIDFVLADFLANPDSNDWERTRDLVSQRYQGNAAANGFVYRAWYESSVNLAAGLMALLYGQMDFTRTVQIGTLSGWDSDNGTATMGGLVAFIRGQSFLDEYNWVSDNFWITRTRDDLPDYTPGPTFDGEDTFTLMGRRMLPIIDREVLAAGGRTLALFSPTGVPSGTWVLPPGGAGPAVSAAVALDRSPTQQEFARSATWSVRLPGGVVTPTSSVPGAPEAGFGSGAISLIADGQESDWRGLEELGSPRGFYSTQRAGANPPPLPQSFTITYDRPVPVHTIRFIGGRHYTTGPTTGGWFQSITPQILIGGEWVAPALKSADAPSPASPFAVCDFVLTAPMQTTAIRVLGLPGGAGAFVTCMELDALAPPAPPSMPTFDLDHSGSLAIDDLYAWFAAPADLNADGVADESDLLYLEHALRLGESLGMSARR